MITANYIDHHNRDIHRELMYWQNRVRPVSTSALDSGLEVASDFLTLRRLLPQMHDFLPVHQ